MPKTEGDTKFYLLCTRATSGIKEAVIRESQVVGLTASEWLRNLIVKESKEGVFHRGSIDFPDWKKRSRKS